MNLNDKYNDSKGQIHTQDILRCSLKRTDMKFQILF